VVPAWNAYSFAFGPVMAFGIIAVLALLLRWAFSSGTSLIARPVRPGSPSTYGLLEPVASPRTAAEGEALKRLLESRGLRATLADTTEGPRVLVFPGDVARAKEAIAGR
jgi:hypothetical protein